MTTIFMDTVGLVALWDEDDQWHVAASEAMIPLDVPGTRLITSPYVLMECANAVARTQFRANVCLLRDQLAQRNHLIDAAATEVEEAWAAYRSNSAGGASIVDHISFIIMRRLGITDAFTNDHHFKAAGFNTLF